MKLLKGSSRAQPDPFSESESLFGKAESGIAPLYALTHFLSN